MYRKQTWTQHLNSKVIFMKYKCAYYEDTEGKSFPTHGELSSYLGKGGKVLAGGKKSITKNTPFADKLHHIRVAYDTFGPILNPILRVSEWYEKELYIFEYGADINLIKTEFPTQFRSFFEIDEELVDSLEKYNYKYTWLKKYATLIERDIELIDFIEEHDIGDDGLYNSFPDFIKNTEAFLQQINDSASVIAEKACDIFKSGWK